MAPEPGWAEQRERMVSRQLHRRGITDPAVLAAMSEVPRERFLPERERHRAYRDGAVSIGAGQTISQPWIVAAICSALELSGTERVLEVGTGSGYSTAVLSRLAGEVVSVERVSSLAEAAARLLAELDCENVEVLVADGSVGVPARAPFDAVAVHAAAPAPPPALISQLRPGGVLVAPVSGEDGEVLSAFRVDRAGGLREAPIAPCRFVPLLGREGYPESG